MIRVGVAGWSYADWEGRVHPRPKPRGYHALETFAKVFGCVEINVSFYRELDPRVVHGWLERTRAATEFRYAVKLHQDFTHRREQAFATPSKLEQGLKVYRNNLGDLLTGPELGACLLQFPHSFLPTVRNRRYLASLIDAALDLRPVLELRHRDWYASEHLKSIEARGASLAVIDLPSSHEHPPPDFAGLGPLGYLRLHGRNARAWFARDTQRDQKYDYRYTREELEPLAQTARRLSGKTDDTYVVTNNHFAGKAVSNAVELLDLIGTPPTSLPALWREVFPELAAIAPSAADASLFD